MAHVLPLLLHISHQLTALPVSQLLDGPIIPALLLACGMLAQFTLWKQSCPMRSSPMACGGTSHPTMCSDSLTHVCQNASGGFSGASSCCDEVGSSCGQCPPPEMPTTPWGGSQRRGVDGWKAGLAGESSASPGSPMDREGHNSGCWGSSSLLRAALSFPMSEN